MQPIYFYLNHGSAFWKGVSAVVLSAGNSESEIYGSSRLMPSEGVTELVIIEIMFERET